MAVETVTAGPRGRRLVRIGGQVVATVCRHCDGTGSVVHYERWSGERLGWAECPACQGRPYVADAVMR